MFIIKIELNNVNMNNFVDHNEVRLMASLNLVSEILNVPDRLTTCSTQSNCNKYLYLMV